jgi:hypothetical protein
MRTGTCTPIRVAAAALMFSIILCNAGEIYQWKDASGRVHYGDKRHAAADAAPVEVQPPAPQHNPELEQYRKAIRESQALEDAARQKSARQAASQQVAVALAEQNCRKLRTAIAAEQNVAIVYSTDDQGGIRYLDDAERNRYRENLQRQWRSQQCNRFK